MTEFFKDMNVKWKDMTTKKKDITVKWKGVSTEFENLKLQRLKIINITKKKGTIS